MKFTREQIEAAATEPPTTFNLNFRVGDLIKTQKGKNEIGKVLRAALGTAILKNPKGTFSIVGKVPYELTEPAKNAMTPGLRNSIIWTTEQEAVNALLAIGITDFQLSNYKLYGKE